MPLPPITAYIRTRNEARMIGETVRAAASVAAEVIVIDSGSTDDTVAIAEAAGARIVHQPWLGNGRQKCAAEDAAAHDWLLDLDADEIVSDELGAEIREIFARGEPGEKIFRTPMAYVPPGGAPWFGFGGVVRHKLYDRRVVRQPDHEAWDQFDVPSGVATARLQHPILHHAWRDADHLVAKVNKNSTTRARTLSPRSRAVLILRIFFGLPLYFLKRYVVDGLFRGGVDGFSFSMISAFGRWLKDVKMLERARRGGAE